MTQEDRRRQVASKKSPPILYSNEIELKTSANLSHKGLEDIFYLQACQ